MKNNTLLIFTLLMYTGWHTSIYNAPNKYKDQNKSQKKEQAKKDSTEGEKTAKAEKAKKEAEEKKLKYDSNLAKFNKIDKAISNTQSSSTKKKYAGTDSKLKEPFHKKATEKKIDLWKKQSRLEKDPFADMDTDLFSPKNTKEKPEKKQQKEKSEKKQQNVDAKKNAKKSEEKKQEEKKADFFSSSWNSIKSGAKALGKSEVGQGVKEIAKNATTSIASTAIKAANEKVNTTIKNINSKIEGEKSIAEEKPIEEEESNLEENPFANTDTDLFGPAKIKKSKKTSQNASNYSDEATTTEDDTIVSSKNQITEDARINPKSTSITSKTSTPINTITTGGGRSKFSKNKKSKKKRKK